MSGGNTGMGKETARDLSRKGAKVIILCRDVEKAQLAATEITSETGNYVYIERLDLASLKSVRHCADRVLDHIPKIDILVNNAGVMGCPSWKTEDGFEMQFGTNHLGHFLLTELLLPLLRKSSFYGNKPRYFDKF